MKVEHYEVTVKNTSGDIIHLKIGWEADIFEWIRNFKVILKWLTFSDKLIADSFIEKEE